MQVQVGGAQRFWSIRVGLRAAPPPSRAPAGPTTPAATRSLRAHRHADRHATVTPGVTSTTTAKRPSRQRHAERKPRGAKRNAGKPRGAKRNAGHASERALSL